MKNIFLLSALLITTSAFAGPKISSSQKESQKSHPNGVLIINFDQLRDQTKDVSILKPVFLIITAITRLHGRNFKNCCNKSSNQSD